MNRDAIAALRELEKPAPCTVSAWRTADSFRDPAGAVVGLRREAGVVVITLGNTEARFGPAALRSIARVLAGAADDLERDQSPHDRPDSFG